MNLKFYHISPAYLDPNRFCFFLQFRAHKIFANLKKSNGGGHSIPRGDWFEYVSCPHYLAEIIIYLCLAVILGPRHITGIVIFIWVFINQVSMLPVLYST